MSFIILNKATKSLNQVDFDSLNALAAGVLSYPNNVGTERYADPTNHPDGVRIAFPLMPDILKAYNTDPTINAAVEAILPNALTNKVASLTADWFPVVT